ncbi:MAG TPA: DEAD/DEAH box helicase [Candidatus Limnocylindria bacterium]|nr:DEAD/DEAH box helicase [Candidatus Limnocylindria bacterium]
MSFSELGLRPDLLRAVEAQGYTDPTPVQHEAIPLVLAGRDLMAGAQTGTGKTAAFVLPMLQRLAERQPSGAPQRPHPRALILTPTRELAIQVEQSVRDYGRNQRRSLAIYGGVGMGGQLSALGRGVEIVVATPGRLLDHARQGTIDLRRIEILVLDEADRMLDMGFIRDIRSILALLPERRQNLLFSATFSNEIRRLAEGMLDRPASVQVTPRNTPTALVRQVVHPVDRSRKREMLSHLVRTHAIEQALVFTRTKHGANKLAEQLWKDGIATAAIHGNKSQPQRVKALNDFKAGRVTLLIATEVAARGLDIEQLPHVVNYELPMVPSDYVHRIGRTGRAGLQGDAVSLVCVDETPLLRDIERLLGGPIPTEIIPGFAPNPGARPEPIRLRGSHQPSRGNRPPRRQEHAARPARVRRDRRPGRGARIGNGAGRWTSLPGERSR